MAYNQIQINSYVYHEAFHIGIVTDIKKAGNDDIATVVFVDGGEKKIMLNFLTEIDNEFVDEVLSGDFEDYYDSITLIRGKDYFQKKRVGDITFDKDTLTISAKVIGTKVYTTDLEKCADGYDGECSCPVEYRCKHAAALLYKMQEMFEYLYQYRNTKKPNVPVKVSHKEAFANLERFKADTDKLFKNKEISHDMLKDLTKDIGMNCSEEAFKEYLKYVDINYYIKKDYYYDLLTALAYSEDTSDMLYSVMSKEGYTTFRRMWNHVKKMGQILDYIKSGSNSYSDKRFLYYYYNNDIDNALNAMFCDDFICFITDAITWVIEEVRNSESLQKKCYEHIHEAGINNKFLNVLICALPQSMRIDILTSVRSGIYISDEDIKQLTPDQLIAVMELGNLSEKDCLKQIGNIKLDTDEKVRSVAKILETIVRNDCESADAVIKKSRKLPNSKYFTSFLHEYARTRNPFTYRKKNLKNDIDLGNRLDTEALYMYFTPEFEVSELNEQILVRYILKSPTGVNAFEATVFDDVYFSLERNLIDKAYSYDSSSRFVGDIKNKFKDEIEEEKLRIKKEIEQKQLKRRIEELGRQLDGLSSELSKRHVLLSENTKADVEFIINDDDHARYYTGYAFSLEMKVGVMKKYVVKDIFDFFRAFTSERTVEYGKGLTLTHAFENIIPEKREAVELMHLYTNAFFQGVADTKRYLPMTTEITKKLVHALKDSKLTFLGDEYKVTLRELELDVSIDSNFVLKTNAFDNDCKYMYLSDEILVFNKDTKCIDYIKADRQQITFDKFAIANDGLCLEPVMEKFRDNIYPLFYSGIRVDEKIKDKLQVSELTINSYFDYDLGHINVRTVLLKGDQKLPEDKISLPLDVNRYSNYRNYLSRLGFENNVMESDADILSFFSMDMTELKKHCNVYLSDSIQNKKLLAFTRQPIKIQLDGSSIMEAFLEGSEYSDDELEKIIKAIRKKKKYILLSGDRILDISGAEAADFESAVSDLGLDISSLSNRSEISVCQALKSFAHESNCKIDDYLYKMISDIRNFKKADIEVPKVNAELRPYQEEGFKWLSILSKYHVGGILADDMGLGKTLEIITLIKSDKTDKPNLVVCPKSVVFNWVNEFRRFDPEADVVEIYGLPQERQSIIKGIDKARKTTYVTSYDSLRNDMEYYDIEFNNMVLDEAQYIKNVKAQKSQTVKMIKADHKFALTGTPIENSILDLWSIFDFIMPGYFDEMSEFKSNYNRDKEFTSLVAKRIAPFVLRRTKGDVLKDLPEKYERILSVEMLPEQRKVYDAYKMEARNILQDGGKAFDILPYLMRLRQICDDPSLFVENYTGGSGKTEMLMELIDTYLASGRRILVFSQFVTGLEHIEDILQEKGIAYYKITGDTKAQDRIDMMNEFNAENKKNVFLISLKAGGTGLNLTGADTVIHLDPWWNVAAEDQASDRAHRIGQTKNVEVIKLICENSVEQRVIELQNIKKDLIDKLISDNDQSVTGVTLEDIAFILR